MLLILKKHNDKLKDLIEEGPFKLMILFVNNLNQPINSSHLNLGPLTGKARTHNLNKVLQQAHLIQPGIKLLKQLSGLLPRPLIRLFESRQYFGQI